MATLNIEGRKVNVDDGFLKLSPAEQNATVEEIAKSLGTSPQASQPAQAPAAAPAQDRGIMGTVDDYVRAAANGMTFGLADRFAAGMGSATGIGGKSGDYAGNLQREQAQTDRFEHEHPVAAIGSNIAGGVLVPVGAIGAAARGATLGTKTLYGMGAGAGLGGVQGAFSSKDLTDLPQTARKTVEGAVIGAGVGGVLPGAGKIIGTGFNKVADFARGRVDGMSRSASDHLVDALVADTPIAVQRRMMELGPDAMLADAGPAFLGKAQGASLNSDEGRTVLQTALTARDRGTNQRIMGDVDRALGPAEDPQTVTNAIRAHRSDVDSRNYPAAFNRSADVDTGNVLVQLGPAITRSVGMEQRALQNLRDMMMTERRVPRPDPQTGRQMTDNHGNPLFDMVPTPQTNPEILHKIKGELDNVIEYDAPGLGVPAAALSRQQGQLRHFRGMLNEQLERQVPGYLEANRQSAALARRGDAVELGTQYLGNGKTTASPARFEHEFTQLEPGERIAFAKGSRGEIDRKLGTKANDLVALQSELQGEGGWNAAKLATVHGERSAEELINSVDRNRGFRETYNDVVRNSMTAQRLSAKEAMNPTPASQTPLIGPGTTGVGLVAGGAKKALGYAYNALRPDETRAYGEIAQILTQRASQRDATTQAIIDALNRRQGHVATSTVAGDRAALIAAIAAHGAARSNRNRKQERE